MLKGIGKLKVDIHVLHFFEVGNKLELFPLLEAVDYMNVIMHIITSTSEWVITLWRSCELFFRRDISRVHRMSEISYQKQWTRSSQMITTN